MSSYLLERRDKAGAYYVVQLSQYHVAPPESTGERERANTFSDARIGMHSYVVVVIFVVCVSHSAQLK